MIFGPFSKHAQGVRDIPIDFYDFLEQQGTTIASAVWTPETGITVAAQETLPTIVVVRVSGGEPVTRYKIEGIISLSDGQTIPVTIVVAITKNYV